MNIRQYGKWQLHHELLRKYTRPVVIMAVALVSVCPPSQAKSAAATKPVQTGKHRVVSDLAESVASGARQARVWHVVIEDEIDHGVAAFVERVFAAAEEEKIAKMIIEEMTPHFDKHVVTEIRPFEAFYQAETNHQNYYQSNPEAGYCQVVIEPKLAKFRKLFKSKLKSSE